MGARLNGQAVKNMDNLRFAIVVLAGLVSGMR